MKAKYLYFILPLVIVIALMISMRINGNVRFWFPIVFLIITVSVIGWTVIIFDAIYKEYTHYKYYANSEFKRANLAKDPKRFHLSVLYIMAAMLDTEDNGKPVEKMRIMVRYIRDVVPKEHRNEAVSTLDFLTRRVAGSGKQRHSFSVIDRESILANNEGHFFYDNANAGSILNEVSGWRMAEELAKYISATDRLYIMYILFQMAIADNNVTTGSYSEAEMLKEICVKGMKLPMEALRDLYGEWQSGNIIHWYTTHITNKGNYPAPNIMADLFRHKTAANLISLDVETALTSNLVDAKAFMEGEFIAAFTMVNFYFLFSNDLMRRDTIWWVVIGLYIGMFIAWVLFKRLKLIPHSSILGVLRTKYEDYIQSKSLKIYFFAACFTTLLCWFSSMNSLLIAANNIYYRKELTLESTVTGTSKSHSRTHRDRYYVYFSPVSVENVNVDEYNVPDVSAKEKAIINALPYLSGYKLFYYSKNDEKLKNIEVNYSSYCNAEVGSTIRLSFKVGYYGMIYSCDYNIEKSGEKNLFR